jgi:hypothetical protein
MKILITEYHRNLWIINSEYRIFFNNSGQKAQLSSIHPNLVAFGGVGSFMSNSIVNRPRM